MTHPDYWNSVPYSAELDSAAKVPTAASTGKQGFGAAILDSELQRNLLRLVTAAPPGWVGFLWRRRHALGLEEWRE